MMYLGIIKENVIKIELRMIDLFRLFRLLIAVFLWQLLCSVIYSISWNDPKLNGTSEQLRL